LLHGVNDMSVPRYGDNRRTCIGILGGSFNPAHAGHQHFARTALRRLRLNQVWLLVSPGNPLKDAATLAPLPARLASAAATAAQSDPGGRRVVATDIERHLHTRYTYDTLRALRIRFPRVRFVWLMGADNFVQFPHWRGWVGIARTTPFAILPRPSYNYAALAGQAACRFAACRRRPSTAATLACATPPAWVFLGGREDASSATALRRQGASPYTNQAPARQPGERLSPASPHRPPKPAPPKPRPSAGSPRLP
jgi:nicotinate-nucleotide adenylyltransferase